MNPSTNDRLDSILRSLSGVILPALPPEASLAKEQTQLIIGHLSILRGQLDAQSAFEAEEAEDFVDMGRKIAALANGGPHSQKAIELLNQQISDLHKLETSSQRTEKLQLSIDQLLVALKIDGTSAACAAVKAMVFELGSIRAKKDRQWFMPMGFDRGITGNNAS